jgi:hypothetical protein
MSDVSTLELIRALERRVLLLEAREQRMVTPVGGIAIKMLAGETLAEGEVVQCTQPPGGADLTVFKNALNSDMPLGVVYQDAAQGAVVYVVVSGIGYVLPLAAATATRGYVIYSSGTTAGRVDQAATVPAIATHVKEVGHFIETGSGNGVKARAVLHFN